MPESDISEPLPIKTPSKKKTIRKVKSEDSPEPLAVISKRPRLLTSSELALFFKRSGVTTRRRAQAEIQLKDVDDDELPSVEELVKSEK
jgi:hypothetical protein